jgi:hypothetical protein
MSQHGTVRLNRVLGIDPQIQHVTEFSVQLPKLRVAGLNPVSRSKVHAASHAASWLAALRLAIRVASTRERQLGMAS